MIQAKKVFELLQYQSKIELYMASFFLVIFIYLCIVFLLKSAYKGLPGTFLLKYRSLLCNITYLIVILYLMIGCFIRDFIDRMSVYIIILSITSVVVNYLCIQERGIKKFKDVEFESLDNYYEVLNYLELNDMITEGLTDYCSYVTTLDDEDLPASYSEFTYFWLETIADYLNMRIKKIDFQQYKPDDNFLLEYFNNILRAENTWFSKKFSLNEYVKKIKSCESIQPTKNSIILRVDTKKFSTLLYIEAMNDLELCYNDICYIVNTYKILSLV